MKYMYMTEKEQELPYYQFPKFLLEMNLSQNARVIYMLLYDRGRLSRKNRWIDEDGYVYSVFPIAELSRRFGKCQSSVKSALKELGDAGLLIRRAWGVSKPKRLYIRIPEDVCFQGMDEKAEAGDMASGRVEMQPVNSWKSGSPMGKKAASSKVKEKYKWNNNDQVNARSNRGMPNYTCEEGESL